MEKEFDLKELKKLNEFAKKLASVDSIEKLMHKLKGELQRFNRVKTPTLIESESNHKFNIFHFQGNVVGKKITELPWPDGERIRINDHSDQKFLAQTLERPVTKSVFFPIPDIARPAVVFVEHDLHSEKLSEFVSFLGARLQAFAITLDMLLIEQELRTSTLMWEKSFEGMKDPVAIIDKSHRLIRANSHFGQERAGEKCYVVFRNGTEVCKNCPISEMQVDEDKLVLREDSEFDVKSFPISYKPGEPVVGYINQYVDTSRISRLKSEFIQGEKMAVLGQLAGNLAHELNNPLTGIRSMCQLLLSQENLGETLRADIVEVEKASHRCQAIIGNLLDFTKTTSGDLSLVNGDVVLEKTIPLIKSALRSVNLSVQLDGNGTLILGEGQLLQQVFFNLVMNSIQAIKESGNIEIGSKVENSKYIVWVMDDGVGMSEEQANKVFEPFFTTKPVGEGTGLGLSMVKSIVEKFSGQIELETQLSKGTKITLIFPAQEK